MHFLDVDKTSSIKKSTFLIAILFVISFAIGLGGGLQQFIINTSHFKPNFDLTQSPVETFIKQLGFHLIPFLLGIIGIFFVTHKILHRPIGSLFGESIHLFKKLLFAIATFVMLTLVFLAIRQLFNYELIPLKITPVFWIYFCLVLVFVFVQILFEELLFRAFFPQTLVGLGLTKISAVILSSIIFGLLHASNPEVVYYGKIMILLYIINGFFLGAITYFDNSLWLAIGYHFANNFLSLVFVSSSEQVLKVPSFFVATQENNNLSYLIFQLFITIVIFFAAGFKLFRWKLNK
jgi:hypothetical protein